MSNCVYSLFHDFIISFMYFRNECRYTAWTGSHKAGLNYSLTYCIDLNCLILLKNLLFNICNVA